MAEQLQLIPTGDQAWQLPPAVRATGRAGVQQAREALRAAARVHHDEGVRAPKGPTGDARRSAA